MKYLNITDNLGILTPATTFYFCCWGAIGISVQRLQIVIYLPIVK